MTMYERDNFKTKYKYLNIINFAALAGNVQISTRLRRGGPRDLSNQKHHAIRFGQSRESLLLDGVGTRSLKRRKKGSKRPFSNMYGPA
jgi:hypothetical protein